MTPNGSIILSCEHASNRVPARLMPLFQAQPDILQTHRGYDLGIAALAQKLAGRLEVGLHEYPLTRLLVDPNRCLAKNLFSEFSERLLDTQKTELLETYYHPYQQHLADAVADLMSRGRPVLHLSLHSFTPVLKGRRRNADMGILYDPSHPFEKYFALNLQRQLQQKPLKVRRNYPYRGRDDGLTRRFRSQWSPRRYLGLELEFNQQLLESLNRDGRDELVTFCEAGIRRAWTQTAGQIRQKHRGGTDTPPPAKSE